MQEDGQVLKITCQSGDQLEDDGPTEEVGEGGDLSYDDLLKDIPAEAGDGYQVDCPILETPFGPGDQWEKDGTSWESGEAGDLSCYEPLKEILTETG